MSFIHDLSSRWAQSRYLTRAAVITYAAPMAIWGVCTGELAIRCALRALHWLVAFNKESADYRWKQTTIHAKATYGTGLMTLVSAIPIVGTYHSYPKIFELAGNHLRNTWKLRDLEQRTNAHAADSLYNELNALEPNVEKIIADATKTPKPSAEEIERTASDLKASLVNHSWIYTILFHTVDKSCRALRIVALRVERLISALLAGHLRRAILRGIDVIINGAKQEISYACNLVDQPNRSNVPETPPPNLYRDNLESILKKCSTAEQKERARLIFTKVPLYRQYAVSNAITRVDTDGPLPRNAPNDYLHLLRELPKALTHYLTKAQDKKRELRDILKYFAPLFSCMENFNLVLAGPDKGPLLLELSTKLPRLRTITLDMAGVDPRWQMLIAVQFARHCPNLLGANLVNADARVVPLMRRFARIFCNIN